MWESVSGFCLDRSPEMPHAEKNFTQYVYDSSIEPCLKKRKPEYSPSWPRRGTAVRKQHETQPEKRNLLMVSEDRNSQSVGAAPGNHSVVKFPSKSFQSRSYGAACDGRNYNKTEHHSFAETDKCRNNLHASYSATSSAFIGPLFLPAKSEKRNPPKESPCFKITTVELGKTASQSKGEDGIDYELRQFYKELDELQPESDEQTNNVIHTVVANQQRSIPSTNKAQALLSVSPHSQAQPFSAFPNKPSHLTSFNSDLHEVSTSQVKRPPLPLYNRVPFDNQTPYNPMKTPFFNHAIPPPGFEACPPAPFIVPFGPSPPSYNNPFTFPRQNHLPPPPYNQPDKYNDVRNVRPPWNSSHVPPERKTDFQGRSHTVPVPPGTGEMRQQEHQHQGICEQRDNSFGDLPLHHTSNTFLDKYPYTFRNNANSPRKLVLLRGVPGSGKSTLARSLLDQSPYGIVFSTDDYFCQETGYTYDVKLLGDAHSWNQNRAKRAMDDGRSPIIIDNTNIQSWEMKPYVQMAIDRSYAVEILEPDTWWKMDPYELEKRNTHRVPRDKISQMLERYESDMTVSVIMNSDEPRRVRSNPPEARPRWGASVDCSHHSISFHSR